MQPIDAAPDGGPPPATASVERASTRSGHGGTDDPLTGLPGGATVQRHLGEAFEQSGGGSVGLIRCGVDRFDWINDALGLSGGDEALRRISDLLSSVHPPPAMVGRLGGDEFVIVLPTVSGIGEVMASVRELERCLQDPLTIGAQEVFVALSIGPAAAAREDVDGSSEAAAARIIREAGAAMRRVKEGRRRERFGMSGVGLLQLDADLHHALDRGDIATYFQPQYDARTGGLTGFEALARWQHPQHGLLAPDRFIPLAEADDLIHRLGDAVLEQSCRFAALAEGDRPLDMAVNVSTQQLGVPGLAERVEQILAGYPGRAWTLTLEITESALIREERVVLAELERLRDLGVGVSIDDFGSGYSSLSQLRNLPATQLKIDRSFVQQEDTTGERLLAAIIALAGSLDLAVVAEGIETGAQLALLRELGCDQLQGMYLCPPLPPDRALAAPSDISALLSASR